MTVVRTFSSELVDDFVLPFGSGEAYNPQSIVLRSGGFATVVETNTEGSTPGFVLLYGDHNPFNFTGSSDPRAVDGYDSEGHAAIQLTYTGWDGHVIAYRHIYDPADTSFHVDLGIGYNPDIAVSGYAITTAVAYQYDYSSTDTDIVVKILDENGGVTNSFVVDDSAAKDTDMHIANAFGGFVVTWNRVEASGRTAVWYATYDFDGNQRIGPTLVDAGGAINSEPVVADTRSARFAIAYEDSEFNGDSEIRLFTQGSSGVPTYTRVTTLTGRDHGAAITELDGILAITFAHDVMDGDTLRASDIYLALADATGNMLTDPAHPIVIAEGESVKQFLSIDSFDYNLGRLIVSYYDDWDGQVHQKVVALVETITGDGGANVLSGTTQGIVHIDGGAGNDNLSGSEGADQLRGGADDDNLFAGLGDDLLDGGTGTDTLILRGSPTATVIAVDLRLSGPQDTGRGMKTIVNIENVIGHDGVDTLIGNAAANLLDDGGGIYSPSARDTLIGGGGNDTYVVSNAINTILEDANGGAADVVQSWVTFTLPNFVENLTLLNLQDGGAINNFNATGNGVANVLTGNTGVNILNGGGGADTMRGLAGNDTYIVDNAGDQVIEAAGGGTDTVKSWISWTLANNIERLQLLGTGNNATGNAVANQIYGNAGNNVINGGAAADRMEGFAGNDTYVVDNAGDQTIEAAGGGTDIVKSWISWALADNIERLQLLGVGNNATGNGLDNQIYGNAGNNSLNGSVGADRMEGFAGNDSYFVDNAGDQVIEAAGGGTDTVRAWTTWTLGANLERLVLLGTTQALNGAGNSLNNELFGNAGNNRLAGWAGNDILTGGAGMDTFIFNTALNATTNRDTITDFSVADDTIRLENSIFTAIGPVGTLAAAAFHIGTAATTAAHRIIYNSATGTLTYDSNGSAAGGATQFAILDTGLALTNADFLIS